MSMFKTTIVIWTKDDVSDMEIQELVGEAVDGEAVITKHETEEVDDPENDPDYDPDEFSD